MEWLVVLIIGIFVLSAMGSGNNTTTQPSAQQNSTPASGSNDQLTFSAKLEPRVDAGQANPNILTLWVRGFLQAPDSVQAVLQATIRDSEEPDGNPVLTLNAEQQAPDSIEFLEIRTIRYSPVNKIAHLEWATTGIHVIISSLVGPKGGARKLCMDVLVRQTDGFVLWRGTVLFSANLDFGYKDADERAVANQSLSIQLAVAVAAISGGVHEAEIATLNNWIKKNTEALEPEDRTKRRRSLVATLRTAQNRAEAGTLQVSKLVSQLQQDGTRSGRMMAVELCFAIMAADGVASADELDMVNKIATKLDVDSQLLSAVRDKALSGLSSSAIDIRDRYAILGIDASGDPSEIRARLSTLYKKWSSRATTLTDPKKRKEAEDMLRLIAEIRAEH